MVSITNLKLWNDPGFTEGAVEVPKWTEAQTAPSGNPQAEFTTGLYPDKKDLWRRLQVKASYTDLLNVSYLQMAVSFNDGSSGFFFGWIDRVEMLSDNEGYEMCGIDWHVDHWRTYLPHATFGYGRVRRRSAVGSYPMQDMPYRFTEPDTLFPLLAPLETITVENVTYTLMWMVVSFVRDFGNYTTPGYTLFPFLTTSDGVPIRLTDSGWFMFNVRSTSPQPEMFGSVPYAYCLQDFGISASSVTGVWIVPRCPLNYTHTTETISTHTVHVFQLTDINGVEIGDTVGTGNLVGYFIPFTTQVPYLIYQGDTIGTSFESDEKRTVCLADGSSHVVYTLPPRFLVNQVQTMFEITASTCYIRVSFLTDSINGRWIARMAGLEAMVPAQTYSIATNSWSDYIISGQRDYDIQQRKQANEAALVNGLTGSLSGGAQGAMIGELKSGSTGAKLGALGAAGGVASAVGTYAYETSRADTLQGLEDRKAANQIDTLAYTGGEMSWLSGTHGCPYVIMLEKDDYSCDVYDSQISLNGIAVDEPTSDCSALCQGTGPLQVQNLIVGGSIPVEAKQYIKARFNSGVRLK